VLAAALVIGMPAVVTAATPGSAAPTSRPTMPPAGVALAYPDGCAAYALSPRRCAYIVDWAKAQGGFGPTDQVGVELLGDPDCPDGSVDCFPNRTQTFVVRVRITGPDGTPNDASVFCGIGGSYSLLCTDTPAIRIGSPTSNGYLDVPCQGEAPEGPCASPVPPPDAAGRAAARPLDVPDLRIPIDHVGSYTVPVGEAILPNGILSDASFTLANASPTDVLIVGDGMTLRVESLEGGPPFENIHDHGWHPGGERVRATLVFDVEWFEAGAVLDVEDIVVR
jgi:hypothetical protein